VLPRLGTQRNPDRPTLGGHVADVAERLGAPLMPHQRLTFDVGLEYDPDSGRFDYDEIDLTVMRQVGKTTGLFVLMVWREVWLSLVKGYGRQRTTFTMQTRNDAKKKLERDFVEMLRASDQFVEIRNPKGRPGRSPKQWRYSANNGSEHLLFGQGNFLQIDAPVKRAGHGDTLDLGVIDEARFQVDDRIEQAMRPAQQTRRNAQLWVASTAGDEQSFYLWPKVVAGRRTAERGERSRVCYLEWSIPADADLDDPDTWFEFHPAIGRTITLDFIMAELARARRKEGGEDVFRQEYANQWVRTPILDSGERELVVDPAVWADRVEPTDDLVGGVALAVDVSPNGVSASIAVAGRTPGGRAVVDVVAFDVGTFWLEQRIVQMRDAWEPKVIGYYGPHARALAPEIGRAAGTVPVKEITPADFASACEGFVVALTEDRLRHLDQPSLNSAIDGAAKLHRGARWMLDRVSSLVDISPAVSAVAAHRLLGMVPDDRPPAPLSQIW
jgi:hypothetical protein